MEEIKIESEMLLHLARLGIESEPRQVASIARRIARKLSSEYPTVAKELVAVVQSSTAMKKTSPLRRTEAIAEAITEPENHHLFLQPVVLDQQAPLLPIEVKNRIEQLIQEQQRSEDLIKEGLYPDKTALFTGPPGVGKTMSAHWVAKELNRDLYVLNLASVVGSRLGQTGANLSKILDYASKRPCVLLLDEVDALAKRRDDDDDIGEMKRIVTVLLQSLDRWPSTALLIGTTNHSELLDRAVWRRFATHVQFPTADSCTTLPLIDSIFKNKVDRAHRELLAALSEGDSFANITSLSHHIRKRALLESRQLEDVFVDVIQTFEFNIDKSKKRDIATKMFDLKFSQRRVSEITGLARETLRKMQTNKEN